MKLELTLPERPGFLHAMPVLDLFALLWLLFLLAPSLVLQSGVGVELPPSRFQLDRYEDSLVVTLKGSPNGLIIHFGREQVSRAELETRLDSLLAAGADRKAMVLLQSDESTPVGLEREISEMVLGKGFRLALVGTSHWKPEGSLEDE